MKTCLRCQKSLPVLSFHSRTHISKYTNEPAVYYTSYCKSCNKVICKERRHSLQGLYNDIYNGQICSSKKRKHALPNYTLDELVVWLNAQPRFQELFDAWVASRFNRWTKPSPDRLDESQPYTLKNLQLLSWQENSERHKTQMVHQGDATCRPVNQYTKDGQLIHTHHSLSSAARAVNGAPGNILRCCRGEYASSKGFIWSYADE